MQQTPHLSSTFPASFCRTSDPNPCAGGWEHYALHRPEPHILLFRRPLGTDPRAFSRRDRTSHDHRACSCRMRASCHRPPPPPTAQPRERSTQFCASRRCRSTAASSALMCTQASDDDELSSSCAIVSHPALARAETATSEAAVFGGARLKVSVYGPRACATACSCGGRCLCKLQLKCLNSPYAAKQS